MVLLLADNKHSSIPWFWKTLAVNFPDCDPGVISNRFGAFLALLVCQPGVGFLTAEVARSSMKCRPNFYHPRRVALSSTACGVCITAKMPNQTHQTRGFMASFLRIRRAKNTIKYYLTQCASSLGWLQINVFFFQ